MTRSTISTGASGRKAVTGGSRIRATSAGFGVSIGGRAATATTGVIRKSLTGNEDLVEGAGDRHAGGVRVEPDLLRRLAQGRFDRSRIGRFGLAARQADLAAVMAVV